MVATLNISPSFEYGTRKNIYKTALTALYDKKKIWNQLNEERRLRQQNKEMEKNRFANKKIYTIDNKKYYKVIGMSNSYYLQVNSLNYLRASQVNIQLCQYTFNGMKSKKGLLKIDKVTNKIFISEDTVRVYFKSCALEAIS
ncbi:MAG: hypothetical protein COA92_05710 [Sulfurovum sp.]|nr:MAG: hypothetical protein COA92_05710 [Sulfurovum sp.]